MSATDELEASPLEQLAGASGRDFPSLLQARNVTRIELEKRREALARLPHDDDTAVVLVGSWGRAEVSSGYLPAGGTDLANQRTRFPYFKQLDSEGRLLPTLDDYTALEKDRGRRFVEHVTRVMPRLLEQARDQPEVEQSTSIGGSAELGVVMEVVETLEEVYLRVSPLNLRPAWLEIILAAVFGDRQWEVTDRFPNLEPSVVPLALELCPAGRVSSKISVRGWLGSVWSGRPRMPKLDSTVGP